MPSIISRWPGTIRIANLMQAEILLIDKRSKRMKQKKQEENYEPDLL